VQAPSILSVSLDTSTIVSGGKATFTVLLNGAAPSGGLTVNLSSSNACASIPPTLLIPGGGKSGHVVVKGNTVSTSTQSTLTAAYGSGQKGTVITVNPS
jgi:hypothetical protein